MKRFLYSACAVAMLHAGGAAAFDGGEGELPCNDFCKTWMNIGRKAAPKEPAKPSDPGPAGGARRSAVPLDLSPPAPSSATEEPAPAHSDTTAAAPEGKVPERQERVRAGRTRRATRGAEEGSDLGGDARRSGEHKRATRSRSLPEPGPSVPPPPGDVAEPARRSTGTAHVPAEPVLAPVPPARHLAEPKPPGPNREASAPTVGDDRGEPAARRATRRARPARVPVPAPALSTTAPARMPETAPAQPPAQEPKTAAPVQASAPSAPSAPPAVSSQAAVEAKPDPSGRRDRGTVAAVPVLALSATFLFDNASVPFAPPAHEAVRVEAAALHFLPIGAPIFPFTLYD